MSDRHPYSPVLRHHPWVVAPAFGEHVRLHAAFCPDAAAHLRKRRGEMNVKCVHVPVCEPHFERDVPLLGKRRHDWTPLAVSGRRGHPVDLGALPINDFLHREALAHLERAQLRRKKGGY